MIDLPEYVYICPVSGMCGNAKSWSGTPTVGHVRYVREDRASYVHKLEEDIEQYKTTIARLKGEA